MTATWRTPARLARLVQTFKLGAELARKQGHYGDAERWQNLVTALHNPSEALGGVVLLELDRLRDLLGIVEVPPGRRPAPG